MNKDRLLLGFEKLSENIFISNNDSPWMPEPSLGNFRELYQDGFFEDRPAKFHLIPDENVPPNYLLFTKITHAYNELVVPGSILLPKILKFGTYHHKDEHFSYEILERPVGERPISMELFKGPCSHPTVMEKIRKIAAAYWATTQTLAKVTAALPEVQAMIRDTNPKLYFQERFKKWERERSRCNNDPARILPEMFLDPKKAEKVLEHILTQSEGIKMGLFRNLFGNTGMVETAAGEIYLTEGVFEIKPFGFGIAAFLWNMALYGWRKQSLTNDVYFSQMIFETVEKEDHLVMEDHLAICNNLLERFYAGLQVDHFCQRSPFNQVGKAGQPTVNQFLNSAQNFCFILDDLMG